MKTLEQQDVGVHDACNAALLRPPYFGVYNSILITFVGMWESLKTYYFPPHRNETPVWLDFQQSGPFFETHLNETALMLMDSVHRGDQAGADYIAEVLLAWFGQLHFRFETHRYLFRRESLLSFEVLNLSWTELQGRLGVEWSHDVPAELPKSIFAVALQNYWIDVCCAISYMLAIRGKSCECNRSIPARLLKAMIFGVPLRKESRSERALPVVRNANELFLCRVPPDSEHEISESKMAIDRRLKPPGGSDGQTESMERREALSDRQRSAESKRAGRTNRQTASGLRRIDIPMAG